MLFSSLPFIFLFLPATLILFYLFARFAGHYTAITWLIVASLIFYGYWSIIFVPLILMSMLFNFFSAHLITSKILKSISTRKTILIFAITINLVLLGYFKYTNFFITNLNTIAHFHFHLTNVILPLGISFYTFTQIAYLVDTYRYQVAERNLLNYGLFVTIFPHLIAGPIINHRDIIPQFKNKIRFSYKNMTIGLCIFSIGLLKKAFFADHVSYIADTLFGIANTNHLSLLESWGAALAYTFQIYFDFSGYADMAIGLARMLGITFPANFNSPYKSLSIIDFWRRWHMTLSSFLKNYLYIPLGGNRRGEPRRYFNIMITMFLGGLWHGAGWTFVLWGVAHGLLLTINHLWRSMKNTLGFSSTKITRIFCWLATFISIVCTWVLFRADNLNQARTLFSAMFNIKAFLTKQVGSMSVLFPTKVYIVWQHVALEFFVLFVIVLLLPNTQQILSKYNPILGKVDCDRNKGLLKLLQWRPNFINLATYSSFFIVAVTIIYVGLTHDFIYYQF